MTSVGSSEVAPARTAASMASVEEVWADVVGTDGTECGRTERARLRTEGGEGGGGVVTAGCGGSERAVGRTVSAKRRGSEDIFEVNGR